MVCRGGAQPEADANQVIANEPEQRQPHIDSSTAVRDTISKRDSNAHEPDAADDGAHGRRGAELAATVRMQTHAPDRH